MKTLTMMMLAVAMAAGAMTTTTTSAEARGWHRGWYGYGFYAPVVVGPSCWFVWRHGYRYRVCG